jgi:pimeloyl-ACP methyl ester carboxylesterase
MGTAKLVRRLGRWRIGILAALVVLLAAAFLYRQSIRAWVAPLARLQEETSISSIRLCRCNPDSTVRFARTDSVPLVASVYGDMSAGGPKALILHGNTPIGRRLAFYRVLASKLRERGYAVLAIDFAGYGDSGDPFAVGTVDALDPSLDAEAALAYMTRVGGPRQDITVVGHSGGAVAALRVAPTDERVARVVLIGPPRRTAERLADPEDRDYFRERHQRSRLRSQGSPFPSWYTRDVWLAITLATDMEEVLPGLAESPHHPMLFVDSDRESEEDLEYLRRYVARVGEPKRYVTIANADHYSNTENLGSLVAYDRVAVNRTVTVIDDWVRQTTP